MAAAAHAAPSPSATLNASGATFPKSFYEEAMPIQKSTWSTLFVAGLVLGRFG